MRYLFLFFITLKCFASNTLIWEKEASKGFEASLKENKPLLLFFTGSDCSPWGMKLKQEILESDEFSAIVRDHFIFVEVDFPEHKEISDELKSQNALLKEKWKIHDLPRLLLINAEGKEIGRFGSTSLNAKEFASDLLSILEKDGHLREELKKLPSCTSSQLEEIYKLARELEREEEAMRVLEMGCAKGFSFFLLEKYRFLVERGSYEREAALLRERLQESDPMNEKKIHFSLALIDFQRLSNEKLLSPFIAIAPLEEYLQKFGKNDEENRWRLEMMVAQFYVDCDEWKTALHHAEEALKSAPGVRKEEIARSLEYIRGELALADNASVN